MVTNGTTPRVTIDSTGNVGIGTVTPGEKLVIDSGNLSFTTAGQYGLKWAGGSRLYEQTLTTGGVDRMLYQPNGDRFEVLNEVGTAWLAGFHGSNSTLSNSIRLYSAVGIGNVAGYAISGTLPTDGLVVAGYVGIGTPGPTSPLHIINASSLAAGTYVTQNIAPTITQSGTAGYTVLKISTTESTTGSGAKLLIDAQVGGTSKFKVDNGGQITAAGMVRTNNAVTVASNAATVPVTAALTTITNNAAATVTITITTTGAVDGQLVQVRFYDFSAVTQTLTWTNTENSTVAAPTTSLGLTTVPLSVGFMYNSATSKWRCIAVA